MSYRGISPGSSLGSWADFNSSDLEKASCCCPSFTLVNKSRPVRTQKQRVIYRGWNRHKAKQCINPSHFSTFVVRISPWSEDSPSGLAGSEMKVMVTPLDWLCRISKEASIKQAEFNTPNTIALAHDQAQYTYPVSPTPVLDSHWSLSWSRYIRSGGLTLFYMLLLGLSLQALGVISSAFYWCSILLSKEYRFVFFLFFQSTNLCWALSCSRLFCARHLLLKLRTKISMVNSYR